MLELISQTHANAATDVDDNGGTATVGGVTRLEHYQGYRFMTPTGLPGRTSPEGWFATQFGQIAVPTHSSSTGTNAYYVGLQGQVWMLGLPENLELTDSIKAVGAMGNNPSGLTDESSRKAAGWEAL